MSDASAPLGPRDEPVPPVARTKDEWARAAQALGGRAFHGKQIFRWIGARGVLDPAAMTDLPRALREALGSAGLPPPFFVREARRAADGTRKALIAMGDGAPVETVLIPSLGPRKGELPSPLDDDADVSAAPDDDEQDDEEDDAENATAPERAAVVRVTQCISTQVGCAMGCMFCASGVAGLKRNLGADEIVAQVLFGRTLLDDGEELRNVVLMGMGEPLHNYDATKRALVLLTDPDGMALSTRRVTVSTCGLVPELSRLGADFAGNIGLAVSLHGADDETRSRLMPINRRYPLRELIDALRLYPLPRRRRITIEYTLIAGENDSLDAARKLVRLLRGLPVKVNLIPMNPIERSALAPPAFEQVLAFQKVLVDQGYSCFLRRRRGDEVDAACGQLALRGATPKVRPARS